MDVVRGLVSKNKRRLKEDGFDLDLTYIYPNIIAMGFPAEKLEGVYRNHVDDVLRFLDLKHKDHYRVYNLCTERHYDGSKFHHKMMEFPFDDHHPPPLELIKPFCEELDGWLSSDERNIAAVHCKAGKGRTGVMICAYLLHREKFSDPKKCLEYYGKTRTRDGKGVTIPSQRRYVEYYSRLLKMSKPYVKVPLQLSYVKFITIPQLNNGTCNVMFDVIVSKVKLGTSPTYEGQHSKTGVLDMMLPFPIMVCGDICVDFFHKPPRIGKKERIFQCWFNTFFITDEEKIEKDGVEKRYFTLSMTKPELDKANKDKTNKIYQKDFRVKFYFEKPTEQVVDSSAGVFRSHTDDSIYKSDNVQHGLRNGGPNGSQKHANVLPPDMSRLNVTDGSSVCYKSNADQKIPPTSQSVPEFKRYDPVVDGGSKHLNKPSTGEMKLKHELNVKPVGNKHVKVSPSGDRRVKYLQMPQNHSDSSLGTFDGSCDSEHENFSDSETDDEWDGCEVTAV
ncbi:hypothetical protein ACF0H5_001877 [Mactra antiquata]